MTDLKPCPFCGRKPKFIEATDNESGVFFEAQVRCDFCHIAISGSYRLSYGGWSTKEDRDHSAKSAIERWNTRKGEE